METQPEVKKKFDWKIPVGFGFLIVGYGLINLIYFAIFGLPLYIIGALFIGFSGKSLKTKLLIIIPPLIFNFFSYLILMNSLK